MNKLITKARAGVTLVELLVVILIVTILSVSMLPLLQPFVTESQYAAEAIPVIGNIRTKVGMYQYEHNKLPSIWGGNQYQAAAIETWSASTTAGGSAAAEGDYFVQSQVAYGAGTGISTPPTKYSRAANEKDGYDHVGALCDIDYKDLKGKRSRPNHYQYLAVSNGTDYVYAVGCFGDNNGLKRGTGYAVCEIVLKNHKYVGTWKRYKPITDQQICFTSTKTKSSSGQNDKDTDGCYVPTLSEFQSTSDGQGQGGASTGSLVIIGTMVKAGWEF